MTTKAINLPDDLAKEAEAAGLLSDSIAEEMVRRELRFRKTQPLFDMIEKLQALNLPPMNDEEIQAEIDAVRVDLRGKRAAGAGIQFRHQSIH